MPIITANSLDPLIQFAEQCDQQTLIIFDINQVLIKEESSIFNIPGRVHRQQLAKTDWCDLTIEQINQLWSKILLDEPVSLVDERVPSLIQEFKQRFIPVIAHTSCPIGKYGNIECMMNWSINRLARNNITLQGTFADYESRAIAVYSEEGSDNTYFKSGILFNARNIRFSKGQVLEAFLNQMQWKPSQIVFIDNQMENLESIESFTQKNSIPFFGLHYTAALESLNRYDEELAQFQFKYLREHGIWMPDHQGIIMRKKQIV